MADVKLLIPKILKFEGGFVDDKDDHGGATNMGVTLATWKALGYDKNGDGVINAEDIKLLNVDDFTGVLKKYYWDKWHGDDIKSQGTAELLTDWIWASGAHGIKIPQRFLGLHEDGIVGPATLRVINEFRDQKTLFTALQIERIKYVQRIADNDPSQQKFLKGWERRINSYVFY